MIADLFQRYFKQKLFNKILVFFCAITILTLILLSCTIYFYFFQTFTQKELNLNKQVISNVSSYFGKKTDASQTILQQIYLDQNLTEDVIYLMQHNFSEFLTYQIDKYYASSVYNSKEMNNFFNRYIKADNDIHSISLYSQYNKSLYVFKKNNSTEYFTNIEVPNEILNRKSVYTQYLPQQLSIYDKGEHLYSFIQDLRNPVTLQKIGTLIVDYEAKGIDHSFEYTINQLKGYIVIVSDDGDVLYDSLGRYYHQTFPYVNQLDSTSKMVKLEEESYVNVERVDRSGVFIAGISPKSQIGESVKGLRKWIVLATLLCIGGAICLAYFPIRRFSTRTHLVIKAMKMLQMGNLSVRIPMQKEDELYQIAESFNRMVAELKTHIDKVYLSELKQKNAEIIALQSQINPHFLYNTLEAIRMRAISKGAEDAGEMIYLLAMLFRNSVKKDMIVTVLEEIEHCKHGLELFRIRYKDLLSFDFNMEPIVLNCRILKLSLQPLIENYLVHGVKLETQDNWVKVSGAFVDQDVHFTIEDNGKGISPDKLHELKEWMCQTDSLYTATTSIGLRNVNERIKLYYGSEYGVDIESVVNQGTKVTLKIPFK